MQMYIFIIKNKKIFHLLQFIEVQSIFFVLLQR